MYLITVSVGDVETLSASLAGWTRGVTKNLAVVSSEKQARDLIVCAESLCKQTLEASDLFDKLHWTEYDLRDAHFDELKKNFDAEMRDLFKMPDLTLHGFVMDFHYTPIANLG